MRGFFDTLRRSPVRRLMVLALDALIALGSLWLAMWLRFEFEGERIPAEFMERMAALSFLLVSSRLASSLLFRLHRWSFRFSGLTDGARVGMAGLLGTGLFMVGIYLLRIGGPPRSVVVVELLLSTVLMAVSRFSPRLAWMYQADRERARRRDTQRTFILGAGAAGEMLLRDLHRSREHGYQVVGLIDDDSAKWGEIVGGKPILGGVEMLPELVRRHQIANLLLAIPRLSAGRIREILSHCADLNLRFKILPVSYLDMEKQVSSSMLQDLSPEDLLPREPVEISGDQRLAGRVALVTGGAGTIGSEIVCQLLHYGASKVVLVDMNENGMYLLRRRLEREAAGRIVTQVADIRDFTRIETLFRRYRPQDVFHAAAHKHVPLMEDAPCEAVKNNIGGTLNVARAAAAWGAERFVFISSDKAVRPTSVMGASKRIGEMVVRHLAQGSETRFCAVRFGNVLDSAGSVVPIFREQIAAGGPVTVTHPEVRRFFMTVSEAVGLVLQAGYGNHGEVCVLEMGEQIRISDLARHMITMSGLTPEIDIPIEYTGLRPGEKLFEELLTEEEERTYRSADKILVAESPPPPSDLLARVEALLAIAELEDGERAVAGIRELVPTFQTDPAAPYAESADPLEADGLEEVPA